ncbi:hypothetical protein BHE74_00055349 [Ensete ventricosum]|nr:hypothetical protein BHE74_00055349 [Ensete ventricosum]
MTIEPRPAMAKVITIDSYSRTTIEPRLATVKTTKAYSYSRYDGRTKTRYDRSHYERAHMPTIVVEPRPGIAKATTADLQSCLGDRVPTTLEAKEWGNSKRRSNLPCGRGRQK